MGIYKPPMLFSYEEGLQPGWILAAQQDVSLVRPNDGRYSYWVDVPMRKGDHFMVLKNPFNNRKHLSFIIHIPTQVSFIEGLLGVQHFQQHHIDGDKCHLDHHAAEYYELIMK